MSILRLAVAAPLRRLLDYLPPAHLSPQAIAALQPGVRVQVPFGRREATAVLVAVAEETTVAAAKLKAARALIDARPVLPPDLLALCEWAADYYQHPVGEVFAAAMPRHLRLGRPLPAGGAPAWRLTARGQGLPPDAIGRAPRQREALSALVGGAPVSMAQLEARGIGRAALRALAEKGLAERCHTAAEPAKRSCRPGLTLNGDQRQALEGIVNTLEGFACHLLEGVTGSGKTEIYLQVIARCLEQGRQALVLVPEIGLGPQTLARFRERFEAEIVALHSGLADGERLRGWEAAASGRADIVIGTRSAVFTALARPGVIVVDEEHDSSYKQQDGFRYSARDVAVKRAQLLGCPVLLGSATPALESLLNARLGRYYHHHLPQRAGSARLPAIETLDIRRLPLTGGIAEPLREQVADTLAAGQQVLLFLNRRGYAPSLQCHDCGWVADCGACDARLTVHLRAHRLRCHHCNAIAPLPAHCPECRGRQLLTAGVGTEQAEQYLQRVFTDWPIYRVDSDSMRGRDAMAELATEVNAGAPCILLGTQMLTKGHHFPAVSLVAVLDADSLLFSPDFRGEERMAQLLTQVAGRAGRAGIPGRVVLQTHHPDHPSLQAMLRESYARQAERMLEARRNAGLPPWGRLLLLRSDCPDAAAGEEFLQRLRERYASLALAGCQLIGPTPSPMPRRQGRYRSQLLLMAPDRQRARLAAARLVALADELPRQRDLNWFIDVDPVEH